MGLPLEKVHKLCGFTMRMKQVFAVNNLDPIEVDAFYFFQVPFESENPFPDKIYERLPFMIPIQTNDWYFIHTAGRRWDEYMSDLESRHAKKLRRYQRKPAKYKYNIELQSPRAFSAEKLARCYYLLCQTMAYNDDYNFYTERSFNAYLQSRRDGILVATHKDGQILGFYSGNVIGHDHALELKSWGVYHNLFIEHVRREFKKGTALIDLGNTNELFKQELGGREMTVCFELRSGMSCRSAVCLALWAISSLIPEDNFLNRALRDKRWRSLSFLIPVGFGCLLLLLFLLVVALLFKS